MPVPLLARVALVIGLCMIGGITGFTDLCFDLKLDLKMNEAHMEVPKVGGAPESYEPQKPYAADEDKALMDIPKVRGDPESFEPQKPHVAKEDKAHMDIGAPESFELRCMVLPMIAMLSIVFCMGIPQVRGAPESTQPQKPHAAKEDKAHMDIPKVRGAPEHEPQKPHLANESLVADTSSSAGSAKFVESDQKVSMITEIEPADL